MSNGKWICALFAAALMMFWTGSTRSASNAGMKEFVLFGGSNTSAAVDTAELATPWIPIRGATRVILRFWSANTAAWTSTDSTFVDSLTTFKLLFSDSMCCYVTRPDGFVGTSAADSIQFDLATSSSFDSTTFGVIARPLPINRPLAASKSGSGFITVIAPVQPLAGATASPVYPDPSGVFGKQFMRIRTQALRRMTEGGRLSTAGKRTVGINKLRGRAYVYYDN